MRAVVIHMPKDLRIENYPDVAPGSRPSRSAAGRRSDERSGAKTRHSGPGGAVFPGFGPKKGRPRLVSIMPHFGFHDIGAYSVNPWRGASAGAETSTGDGWFR
jgi:hypothetical protein